MTRFTGEYDVTLDSKGRFLLPAGLKKILPEGTFKFVLNRGQDNCLNMYLPEDWRILEDKLSEVNPFDSRENRMVRRALIAGAVTLEIDSAGRLNIPDNLITYSGLDKEIVLAGDLNKIEIWDKKEYNKMLEELTPEKVTEMSSKVLGSGAQAPKVW